MRYHRREFLAAAAGSSVAGLAGCSLADNSDGSNDGTSNGSSPSDDPPSSNGSDPSSDDGSQNTLPRLSTTDNRVVDPDGNTVVLRGLNTVDPWWAGENQDLRGNTFEETLDLATNHEEGWCPRAIRIPCQPRSIEEVGVETFASEYLDPAIEHCREQGVYAIVDYHTIEPYDTEDVDERIRAFWNEMAPRYADDPHVLYELFNEPTEPYGNGLDSWNTWRDTAQPWVDLVRGHAPDTPLIIGSPMWTSLTRFAAEAPFEGDDLIYAAHIYPSDGPDAWEDTYSPPMDSVPVMVTEWGYLDVEGNGHDAHMRGTTSGWGEPFREWLEGHETVGWTAWCFDSVWDPQMFTDSWDLMGGEYYMGGFTKNWLYEARNEGVPDSLAFQGVASPSPPDDSGPPAAPSDVALESVGQTSATLSWSPAEDGETSVVMYRVYANGELVARYGEKSTSATVTGLAGSTDHELTVTAIDAAGNESPESDSVTATTGEQTIHAEITRTDTAPSLDGQLADGVWSNAASHSLDTVVIDGIDGPEDLAVEWRALWDDESLYVLVDVIDDSISSDSAESYNDDSIEIYLDGDNSKGGSYDGENDYQFVIPFDGAVSAGGGSPGVGDARQAQRQTPDGWRLEFEVPWSTVGVSVEAGHLIGFDVHVNDDDGGGGRDGKLSWFASEDNAWQDPGLFATVELVE